MKTKVLQPMLKVISLSILHLYLPLVAIYIDSLVMISIEWSDKTQKDVLDVRENYDVTIIRSMI